MLNQMKLEMARARLQDWGAMWKLKEIMEALTEERVLPEDMESSSPKKLTPQEVEHELATRVMDWWEHNRGAWYRCVWGGQMVVEQACDPKSDVLEWSTEIKAALTLAQEQQAKPEPNTLSPEVK